MKLPIDRLVWQPGVALVASMQMHREGFFEALDISEITDAADIEGSPLNDMVARLLCDETNGDDLAEFGGRQCYRSWKKGRKPSEYIGNLIDEAHGSVFRHSHVSLQIVGVSRSLTHELIRHATGNAPSQESQRYVDAKDIRFVVPPITVERVKGMGPEEVENDPELSLFRTSCQRALDDYIAYQAMISDRLKAMKDRGDYKGATAYKKRANEAARALLPNATETRLLFTMNLQSARFILSQRGSEFADLEIRRLAPAMFRKVRDYAPHFFKEVVEDIGSDGLAVITAKNGKL